MAEDDPSAEPSDADLLEAWRGGAAAAGDRLLLRHFDSLYLFFRTKLDGPIDDLIQATLLGAVESRDAFRGDASFRTFLLAIARKQLLRHFRSSYRAGKVFDPAQGSVVGVAPNTSATRKLGKRDDRRILVEGLRHLPLDLQIAVELYYWERLSIGDVAEICGIPPGTVKSRLSRARGLLDDAMQRVGADRQLRETTRASLERWAAEIRGLLPERDLS
ncbi:MAG: RNA polymerase sigma factor [Myxococcota bacterium]